MHLLDLSRRALVSTVGMVASLREARALHPRGTTREATVTVTGPGGWGARILDEPAVHHGVVRLSRAAGLPRPLPDVEGMALRLPGAGVDGNPLDLLMNTAWRYLFVPSVLARTRSSILTYRNARGESLVLGARPEGAGFELLVARPFGPWERWGRAVLGAKVAGEDLCFVPTIGADDLVPSPFLRDLRGRSYEVSQAVRVSDPDPATAAAREVRRIETSRRAAHPRTATPDRAQAAPVSADG